MITGIGTKASAASSGEMMKKTAPTATTFVTVRMIRSAPMSRKRSSWLTSSLRIVSSRPDARSSNHASSRSWTWP